MRFTVVGDLHATPKNLETCAKLFNLIEEKNLPVIMLGDTFDTKEIIRGKAFNFVFDRVKRSKLTWYFLIGNHDLFRLDAPEHALEVFKQLSNVIVVDKPLKVDDMVMFPYIHDRSILLQKLSEYSDSTATLVAHLEVRKFDFGNGHICELGIPLESLIGFKRVISGHFHKFQQFRNLTYLGTPFSHSQGEANQNKFLGVFDSETNELELTATNLPKHLTMEFNCDNLNETLDHWIINSPSADNFHRVILTGAQSNIDRFPKHMYEKLNIKWIARPTDDAVNEVSIDETSSNEVQFQKWATEIRNMDEETLELGMSILEACR